MQCPVFSAIVTTQNRPAYLREALNSIQCQTSCEPREIIVVDDGSDIPAEQELGAEFPAVRWIRQPKSGAAAARQTGVLAAQGEWVTHLDDDDRWKPEKLAVQYQQAQLHPEIDVWIHDCAKFTSEGPLKETSFQAHPNLWQLHPRQLNAEPPVYKFSTGQFIPAFFEGSPFPVPTLMVRRAYMIRIGGWNPALRRCGEDIEFATRVAAESPVGYIDLPLAEVRRGHGGNISADPLKTYEDVAQNFEECIAGYAPALRSTVQRGLGKFYARLGWMCFDKHLFKKAATYYQQALRHGQLSPAVLLKFGLATLRK